MKILTSELNYKINLWWKKCSILNVTVYTINGKCVLFFFVVVDFALLSYTRIKYFDVKKLKGTFKKKEEKLRR